MAKRNKMKILFINSIQETFSNPAYSRHYVLKKLFNEIGEVVSLNLYSGKTSFFAKLLNTLKIKKRVKNSFIKIDIKSFDVVVLTTISYPGMKYIKKICKKLNIILVVDCVEWASPEEKRFGKLSLSYIHNTRINEHLIDSSIRVISISTYFEKYFKSKKICTEVIPNLVDVKDINRIKKNDHNKIELLFAGYPSKKDAINIVVEAMLLLKNEISSHFNLNIAGIAEIDFYKKFKYLRQYKESIDKFVSFLGKVSSDKVAGLYEKADFSVLIRNDKLRVCNAGFPTKLLDSLKYSTPVIANLTSDLGKYLVDGQNGFIVDEFSANSLADILIKIYESKMANSLNMERLCENSFNTCINCFNYLKYVDNINRLLSDSKQ